MRQENTETQQNELGEIEKIVVYYNGDKNDMHPSLKKLADEIGRASCRERVSSPV